MRGTALCITLTSLILSAVGVCAEEIKPGILRTPDSRFENLADFPYTPRYAQVGEVRIHYIDEGPRDAETILLIHGEPTWSYLFRKMIPVFLEAGYRVVAPDLVGFGRSDKYIDEDMYSYVMQVDHMVHLVEELELEDVTFFGQDWGGLIGLRVVAAQPERYARVVVSNTGLPAASGFSGWIGYPLFKLAVWWEGPMTFEELVENVTFPRWVAYNYYVEDLPIGRLMTRMGGDDGVKAAYEAPFPEQRYKAAAQIMPYLVPSQLRENEEVWRSVYEKWDKPFLVAFTDSDPVTRGGEAAFLQRVPTAQNVTIRGAGHFVQEDAGPQLAQLIVDFMQDRELPDEISTTSADAVFHNRLSPDEQTQGWRLLFDGQSLAGWRNYQAGDVKDGWDVSHGTLRLRGEGGDLLTTEAFEQFDLSLEWRVSAGGNSGVFVLADEEEDRVYYNAPEIQILDDVEHPDNKDPTHRSGSLYDLVAAPADSQKAAGEWNLMRVKVEQRRLSVWQNDYLVTELDLNSPEWAAMVADSKFAAWSGFGKNQRGHIGLQDHGNEVAFRNIKILDLSSQQE